MIKGTYGVDLEIDLRADITGATLAQLIIVDPSGKRTVGEATITDAARGTIVHTTQQNVFNREGTYKLQAWITFPDALLKSEPVDHEVEDSL